MSEKLKIEDMTLGQIKDLKQTLSNAISTTIASMINVFNEKYDCGKVGISVDTEDLSIYDDVRGEVIIDNMHYITTIKFSKEDD